MLTKKTTNQIKLSKNDLNILGSFFDGTWYSNNYSDVTGDPFDHFIKIGIYNNRNPNEYFDCEKYLDLHSDVREHSIPAVMHFIQHGMLEKRDLSVNLSFARWVIEEIGSTVSINYPLESIIEAFSTPELKLIADEILFFFDFEAFHIKYPGFSTYENLNPILLFEIIRADLSEINSFIKFPNNKYYQDSNNVSVTAIILNWNKSLFTLGCLASIYRHCDQSNLQIIVVDNGSNPHDFFNLASTIGNFEIFRLAHNQFFGEGNNSAVSMAKGEFLVFLNNDVIFTEDTLTKLVNHLRKNPNLGTVGPIFFHTNGLLQEAGVLLNQDGTVNMLERDQESTAIEFDSGLKIVDYTSAATLAIRKKDFEAVDGFDFMFEPAYYEDVDLCLKVSYYLNKDCVVCFDTSVIHLEHQTTTDSFLVNNIDTLLRINKQKIMERWKIDEHQTGSKIEPRINLVGFHSRSNHKAKDANVAHSQVHIFSPYELNVGGGERYILSLASKLKNAYEVSIVSMQNYSTMRINQLAREFDLDLSGILFKSLDSALNQNPKFFICLGNHIFPPIQNYGKHGTYICQFPFPGDSNYLAQNYNNLSGYDQVVTYSEFSKNWYEKRLGTRFRKDVCVISPGIGNVNSDLKNKISGSIVSVGRFFLGGHNKNLDKLAEIFNKINDEERVHLNLIGGVSLFSQGYKVIENIERLQDSRIQIFPNASFKVLSELLDKSDMYWHGAGLGIDPNKEPEKLEHFGITPLEAMARGCVPFVVKSGGPTEYISHGINGFLYSNSEELMQFTEYFLTLPINEKNNMRDNAIRTASKFNYDVMVNKWKELLEKH